LACSVTCRQYDERCPLCRAPVHTSNAEWLRRIQTHVDKSDAGDVVHGHDGALHGRAQHMLGAQYREGGFGLKQSVKRAFQLYELAVKRPVGPSTRN
jgi:hypothetical protein